MKKYAQAVLPLILLPLLFAACSGETTTAEAVETTTSQDSESRLDPTATNFLPPDTAEPAPSQTPVPLAMIVNGDALSLDEYNLALQRLHSGIPEASTEEAQQRVLTNYQDQFLLSQAAYKAGFALSDADFQTRFAGLIADAGGEEAFTAWLENNLYTRGIFEQELRRSIAATWMRDQIIAGLPDSAEQARARQVRVTTRSEAESILEQLDDGTSFDIMITIYDPVGLGELGWFPRGVLFEPAIEEAAFSLEVGEYSEVVETKVGFHIVQVTDYEADRRLDPDARWALQLALLDRWLEDQRANSSIEVLVP